MASQMLTNVKLGFIFLVEVIMLMPDYHTVQRHAQDRIARCQREAAHAQGDMRNVRQGIAKLLHQLANTLEPTS